MPKSRRWTEDQLREAVRTSRSVSEILRKIGLKHTGGNNRSINHYIRLWEIDTSHLLGQAAMRGISSRGPKTPLSEILVENSVYTNTNYLKIRLINEGVLNNICSCCGLGSEWNGKKLVLQLDHKNGVSNDNRLENLQLICPNCHSQTDNFCSQKLKGTRRTIHNCSSCGGEIKRWARSRNKTGLCGKCHRASKKKRKDEVDR